ncbi:hypothetical protein A6R68_13290, partial [Neotoma lepida]
TMAPESHGKVLSVLGVECFQKPCVTAKTAEDRTSSTMATSATSHVNKGIKQVHMSLLRHKKGPLECETLQGGIQALVVRRVHSQMI